MEESSTQPVPDPNGNSTGNTGSGAIATNQQQQRQVNNRAAETTGRRHGGGTGVVAVMTSEQIEMLRKQICVYASICERLLELHRIVSSQHPLAFIGTRPGNPCGDLLLLPSPAAHKIPSRHRWTPTPVHLEALERLFKECNTTPCRQKIKEITAELVHHGEITETNVYNWFQNRRARSKRKQPSVIVPDSSEPGGGRDVASAEGKMEAAEDIQPDEDMASIISNMHFQGPEIGMDQVIGKMESPKRYWQVDYKNG